MKSNLQITSLIIALVFSSSHLNAQTTSCGTPAGLTASSITSVSATLGWSGVNNAIAYNLRYRISTSVSWTQVSTLVTNANLTGLSSNTVYESQVQAVCPGSTGTVILSPFSSSVFFTTLSSSNVCPVPTGLNVTNVTSTSAVLHWNATGASSYKIRIRQVGTASWSFHNSTTNSKTKNGLAPAAAYEWQVRSICTTGTGVIYSAWSVIHIFQTLNSTTCNAPTGLTSTIGAGNSVVLAWNSTGAMFYNIRYRPNNTTSWLTTTSTANNKTLNGLAGGTTYIWQVQSACGINGAIVLSVWSTTATFTTLSPIAVSPNPANNKIIISLESNLHQQLNINIRDFFGVVYNSETKSASEGKNQYELNTANLKNGIYFVEISGSEGKTNLKFYIRH